MRKLLIEQNAAIVNNRRKRKHCAADEEEADNNLQTVEPPPFDSKANLAKTLQYLNADSLEKERQKNVQFMIRIACTNLTSRMRIHSVKSLIVVFEIRGRLIELC
jgi:hypothetical protein